MTEREGSLRGLSCFSSKVSVFLIPTVGKSANTEVEFFY